MGSKTEPVVLKLPNVLGPPRQTLSCLERPPSPDATPQRIKNDPELEPVPVPVARPSSWLQRGLRSQKPRSKEINTCFKRSRSPDAISLANRVKREVIVIDDNKDDDDGGNNKLEKFKSGVVKLTDETHSVIEIHFTYDVRGTPDCFSVQASAGLIPNNPGGVELIPKEDTEIHPKYECKRYCVENLSDNLYMELVADGGGHDARLERPSGKSPGMVLVSKATRLTYGNVNLS